MRSNSSRGALGAALVAAAALVATGFTLPVFADGGVVYHDITADPANGLAWHRVPSPRLAVRAAAVAKSPIPAADFFRVRSQETPQKGWGSTGVAILDYDNDGDLDLYVVQGPGAPNSLFQSQLAQTGQLTFVDLGAASGAGASDQDSSGVCYGDIDNDGDHDLYVVATGEPNRLFENNGDGTFTDITAQAGVGGSGRHAVGCSFGDIDNDGLLDVVVANTYDDWTHRRTVFDQGPTYPGMEHNYLFHNQGGNVFADVSASSGIENVSNMSGPGLTGGAFTWAIAMADVDQDGDIDILSADNQGGAPTQRSEERGWNRLFINDGSGHFTDVTESVGLDKFGGWMGLDFADLNCDGTLDFFSTNLGYTGAGQPSQWFLQNADGTWTDPGQGDLVMDPFGWGTSILDYDNDGDFDIVYHGGVDIFSLVPDENPGVVLTNQGSCSGLFTWDQGALERDHLVRTVHGMAAGDLNGDGFEDLVSVSNFDIVKNNYLTFAGVFFPPFGSAFDAVAGFEIGFSSKPNPGFQTYMNPTMNPGTLSVEINSADNGNHSIWVRTLGSIGVADGARVNRDGIGAVVRFTPRHGAKRLLRPVVGGSSYGSEDELAVVFGTGAANTKGYVDVLWPGGNHTRLYGVASGERVTIPEIPCDFKAHWGSFQSYKQCVDRAVIQLRTAGVIDRHEAPRLRTSAYRAFEYSND